MHGSDGYGKCDVAAHSVARVRAIATGWNNKSFVVDERFVVRLASARWPAQKLVNEAETLRFLRTRSTAVPELLGVHAGVDPVVGARWMVQRKLPGENGEEVWPHMAVAARQRALRELAAVLASFADLTSDCTGSVGVDGAGALVVVGNWEIGGPHRTRRDACRPMARIKLARLAELAQSSEHFAQLLQPATDLRPAFEAAIAKHIDGDIDPQLALPLKTSFQHGDLATRNLLVDKESGELLGLLDFEYAGFRPADGFGMDGSSPPMADIDDEDAVVWRAALAEHNIVLDHFGDNAKLLKMYFDACEGMCPWLIGFYAKVDAEKEWINELEDGLAKVRKYIDAVDRRG